MSHDTREIWRKMNMAKPELIHHGVSSQEFTPRLLGTDYFSFFHNCGEEAKIKAVLIDNKGRIIFNLSCETCKKADALKIAEVGGTLLNLFHLSPMLGERIGSHYWDDL